MIDVDDLPDSADQGLSAADFTFRTGAGGDPAGWAGAPNPSTIALRRGAGTNGADRVTLIWSDATAVRNAWLQVTMNPGPNTGLPSSDAFYFGNLVGDATGDRQVSVGDVGVVSTHFGQSNRTPEQGDFTADRAVTVGDVGLLSTAFGRSLGVPNLAGAIVDGKTGSIATTPTTTVGSLMPASGELSLTSAQTTPRTRVRTSSSSTGVLATSPANVPIPAPEIRPVRPLLRSSRARIQPLG
jgi:hypothetical protein